MVKAGNFPRPVYITLRNHGYLLQSVEAWMKARLALPVDVGTARLAPVRNASTVGMVARPARRQAG